MPPILKVENLGWTPPDGDKAILDSVDLELSTGDLATLRGSSGSGKSTLLRCIVGLERLTTGRILWQGDEISGDDFLSFRHRVRYAQQRPTKVADTIGEDLSFARHTARERGSDREYLEQRQSDRLASLGLGALEWSRNFDELSVGEQQRVALVRALTSEPNVLLLDEPTSSLDPERVEDVEAIIKDYLAESPDTRAILWVTHQPEQLERLAGRPLDLDDLNDAGGEEASRD